MPSCDLFTSHSSFIVFWERDITSEHHGTPVHISTTVYTLSLLSAFTFCCCHHYHYLLRLILCKQQGQRDSQPLCTRWEQSYLLCVQVQVKLTTLSCERRHCSLYHLLVALESYWRQSKA